jgi:cell division protein FtsL
MSIAAETRARQAERLTVKGGLRDFSFLLLLVTLVGCAVFMTTLRRVAFIEMGYEISQLERKESELLHLQKEMEIEKAMLSSPERIEKVARSKFGLREPEPGQIRVLP